MSKENPFINHLSNELKRFGMDIKKQKPLSEETYLLSLLDTVNNTEYTAFAVKNENSSPQVFWSSFLIKTAAANLKTTSEEAFSICSS